METFLLLWSHRVVHKLQNIDYLAALPVAGGLELDVAGDPFQPKLFYGSMNTYGFDGI